jgi:AAA domain
MADTLSLDTAVTFIIGRGGSVRLVGDDQQLAAIGAGGVLRDIQASYGAVRLSELHRFTDPAEAAATLALRDGRPEALGFYLDRQRVHVGDPTTTLDAVFNAWWGDRSQGLDAIMLAPTRELVRALNQRARDHRLAGIAPSTQRELADGNRASVGDLIITRSNDRRLRVTATEWVKNGDRWTILSLTGTGGLRVRHARNGRIATLPADYVSTATELGYATTVHTAQGVTADTMHGVVTGVESRQQLYTMLTRGRTANHLYVSVVGDGDPHNVIQPDSLHPRTATELLEQILARDASPPSATTLQREQHDPATRLGAATARYLDALHLAAERLTSPQMVGISERADRLLNRLTGEAAWPRLRAHLMLLAAAGADPAAELLTAAALREPMSAGDQAAVIDSRIHDINKIIGRGPLPWLPGIPDRIANDPNCGPYLHARSRLVAELADQVRSNAEGEAPTWAAVRRTPVPAELIADMQLWRAATQVDPSDLRPTGPPQLDRVARIFQQRLDKRLAAADTDADGRWRQLLATEAPSATADPFLPTLEERLSNLSRAGFDATPLVRSAAAARPLPDGHPAAALWWRILDQLPQTPNQSPAPPTAVPATRRTTTTPPDPQPGRPPWSAPPPALGPSR